MIRLLFVATTLVGCARGAVLVAPPPIWAGHLPVAWQYDERVRGHAGSYVDPHTGQCHVLLHPERFGALDPVVQHWTIAHEVAHCEGAGTELHADCDAVRALAPAPADLATLVAHVAAYPESDVHPPGAQRAAELLECAP